MKEAECGNLTTAQLEQVGRFFARASVLGLKAAILSDPERVSPIFHLLPRSWLETAGVTSEEFDRCYSERTGKQRTVQRLEDQAGKDLADNLRRRARKPDEAQKASPIPPHASPDMESWFQKGESYYFGIDVPRDYAEAVKWFRMAAELGYAKAQCFLGLCYARGQGVSQDWAQAVQWYRKAAEQGNADAQCYLGVCYDTPRGVSQDYAQAVHWHRKAAEQGHATAQLYLGFCYEGGRGVPQDYTQAVQWYRKAAEQGDEYAQYNLGLCYEKGRGVPQDYAQATQWYRKAAEQGLGGAQRGLGFSYQGGRGVPSPRHRKVGRHQ